MKNKKTSELIDLMTTKDDNEVDKVMDELDLRYPFDWLDDKFNECDKDINSFKDRISKVEERLDKLDSFWNIANKLDMIIDRLPKKKGEYNRQQKKP